MLNQHAHQIAPPPPIEPPTSCTDQHIDSNKVPLHELHKLDLTKVPNCLHLPASTPPFDRILWGYGTKFFGVVPEVPHETLPNFPPEATCSGSRDASGRNKTIKLVSTTSSTLNVITASSESEDSLYILGTPQDGNQYLLPTLLSFPVKAKINSISSGRNHTIMVSSSGVVLSFGSGHFGQLGHGDDDFRTSPCIVEGIEELLKPFSARCGYRPVSCQAGSNHSIIHATSDNAEDPDVLVSFGFNSSGQCGVGSYYSTVLKPTFVRGFEPKDFENRGKLPPPLPNIGRLQGNKTFSARHNSRPLVALGVDSSEYFSVAKENKNEKHHLSASSCAQTNSHTFIFICAHPLPVAAGLDFTVVATSRNVVYSFGSGKFGKLGVSKIPPTGTSKSSKSEPSQNKDRCCTPIPIRLPPGSSTGLFDLVCGSEFTFVTAYNNDPLDDENYRRFKNSYSFGHGSEGQHALNNHLHLRTPRENEHICDIVSNSDYPLADIKIHARGQFAALHVSGATSSSLYTWGCNDNGATGHPKPSQEESQVLPEFEGPPMGQAWEGRSFDSTHNLYFPKRVDFLPVLRRYFDGDEDAVARHELRLAGVCLGGAHTICIGDVILRNTAGAYHERERRAYEIEQPTLAASPKADADRAILDSRLQYKKDSSSVRASSLDLLNDSSLDLSDPSMDVIEQATSWCRNGRVKELSEIIERGYDIDARDPQGNSLMAICAQNGYLDIARQLIGRGADVNAKNKSGNSPLHFAFYFKHDDFAAFLLRNNADDEILNNDGLTPYEGLKRSDLDNL